MAHLNRPVNWRTYDSLGSAESRVGAAVAEVVELVRALDPSPEGAWADPVMAAAKALVDEMRAARRLCHERIVEVRGWRS